MLNCTTPAVRRIILVMFVLLVAVEAEGTVYFVRRTGKNTRSGTSPSQAWKTIAKAANTMVAGDMVYVGAGTYNRQVSPINDGTSGDPIRFIADTDGAMTGDAGDVEISSASSPALLIAGKDHIQVLGFQINGGQDVVSWSNSIGGLLENCEIYSGKNGIAVGTSCELTVLDALIRDNGDYGICVLDSTSNIGLTVARCTVTGNSKAGIGAPTAPWTGVVVDVTNCLIFRNYAQGIEIGAPSSGLSITVWNATITGNAGCGVEQSGGSLILTNSIVAFNQDRGLFRNGGVMTHSYNLVYGNTMGDYDGTSAAAGEISVDPLFESVGLDDYHLRNGSPAINVGADAAGTVDDDLEGNSRPVDSGWDMGCYEMPTGSGSTGNWRVIRWVEVDTPSG